MLVFRHQGPMRKSDGFTHNGGAEYKGVAIFDQCAAISETVIVIHSIPFFFQKFHHVPLGICGWLMAFGLRRAKMLG